MAARYTTIAQKTILYMLTEGEGRDDFVRYWRLMAQAVAGHPSAVAAELDNEPMSIARDKMFQTWCVLHANFSPSRFVRVHLWLYDHTLIILCVFLRPDKQLVVALFAFAFVTCKCFLYWILLCIRYHVISNVALITAAPACSYFFSSPVRRRACAEAINSVVPDMAVSISDTGEGAVLPDWVAKLVPAVGIDESTVAWIKNSTTLFYAWHWCVCLEHLQCPSPRALLLVLLLRTIC